MVGWAKASRALSFKVVQQNASVIATTTERSGCTTQTQTGRMVQYSKYLKPHLGVDETPAGSR